MISSAALPVPVHLPRGGGAAEAPDVKRPRTGAPTPAGARRNRTPLEGRNRSDVRPYQQRRLRHRPHVQHVGQEGQGLPGTREEGREEVTAHPRPGRPNLSVVPTNKSTPRPAVGPVPLPAAHIALGEMLSALGVTTRPPRSVRTDALLTLLLQASGAHVTVPQTVADHTAWLGAVAGYRTTEAAS